MFSGKIGEAVSVMEAKVTESEVISLDVAPGDALGASSSENDPGIAGGQPSSGFGVGSSSN